MNLFVNLKISDIQNVMNVNYLGACSLIHKILPSMIKHKKGHIVTISSMAGINSSVKMSDYCASKAALAAFHNALRLEIK